MEVGLASRTPLLGREDELDELSRSLDVLSEGPATLTLLGEPGIGKSALWGEGIRLAGERSILVLAHRADQAETRLAFQGLADLLEDGIGDALDALPRPQARAIEVAVLRADDHGSAPDPRVVSTATLGILRTLSASGPVLLAVDDVQWVDASTTGALRFALRRLRDERVGLLAARREDPVERGPEGGPSLLDLPGDRAIRIRVGPLDPGAIDRILAGRLGLDLPIPALKEVCRVSGGNPLFALEIGRVLKAEGLPAPGQPLPVPTEVGDLLRSRVAALPPETRSALEFVAALARPTAGVLRAALGAEPSLDPALDARILELDLGVIRFSHPLIGSAVYDECPPGRKRRIHAELARVVRDREERARHLALAATGPSRSVADALDRAAGSARRRGAPEAAAELFELARSLTPEDDGTARRRRSLEAAEAHMMAQDGPRARRLLEEALRSSPPGTERGPFLVHLAYLTSDLEEAAALLDEAKAEAQEDTELVLRCEYHRSRLGMGRLGGAAEAAREAVRLAEHLGHDGWLALTLTNLELNEFVLGRGLDEARMRRALRHGEAADSLPLADEGYFYSGPEAWLGCFLMWTGALDEARRRLEHARAEAFDHGDEFSASALLLHLTELECLAGNLEAARDHAEVGYRTSTRDGVQEQASAYPLALAYAHLGRIEEARELVEDGIRLSEEDGDVVFECQCRRTGGFLELSVGDLGAARAHLERAEVCAEMMGAGDPCVFPYLPELIEVLIRDGDGDRAGHLIEDLEGRGRRLDRPWALAAAARSRALLLSEGGKREEAIQAAEASLKQLARLPSAHPYELGRSLLVLGEVRRRARQKKAAREALERSAETFAAMGARLWEEKASAELGRIGGRAPAPLELTGSEQAVAEMAVGGHTNREIAAALFVSVRTVESMLTRVYRKTGVTSRRELRTHPRFALASGDRLGP